MASIASGTGGTPLPERAVFVRKATGLVRGWAVRDAFIYATFAINLVTLGWYIFAFAPSTIPNGSLMWAVIVGGLYLIFQAITYASLIAVMPRAGGDYVWMSRVLGGGVGFVLAACGWWFILWHWVPIYAYILQIQVLVPLSAIVGWHGGLTFWTGHTGTFVASIITALLASLFISLGIRTYARIQKFCFIGGMVGLGIMAILLLVNSKTDFIGHFNSAAHNLYGVEGHHAYAQTVAAPAKGTTLTTLGSFNVSGVLLLLPLLMFFNLWSNWGATLYGEVRGASDFRKNIYAMGGALLFTTTLAVIFFLLFAKTFGWTFYQAGNETSGSVLGAYPYPGTYASFLLNGRVLQFIFIGLLTLWFVGWVGSVFLSSTRVVFAAAFDRVLPEWAASVSNRGVPY